LRLQRWAPTSRKIFLVFLEFEAHVPHDEVEETYSKLKRDYFGHVSIGVERELRIDRDRYFRATWDLPPEKYILPTDDSLLILGPLRGRVAILTEVPRVWAEKALKFLGVYPLVQELLFTGESDVRKPAQEAFIKAAQGFGVPFSSVCSVGDQEHTDILPAKAVGMRAVRVGEGETQADFRIVKLADLKDLPLG